MNRLITAAALLAGAFGAFTAQAQESGSFAASARANCEQARNRNPALGRTCESFGTLRELQANTDKLFDNRLATTPEPCQNPAQQLSRLECAELVNQVNRRLIRQLEDARIIASAAAPFSAVEQDVLTGVTIAQEYLNRSAKYVSVRSPQYGFYAGPNFSLSGNGNWKEGGEFLGRFDSEVYEPGFLPQDWWLRGYTDISYQSISALEATDGATQPEENVFASAGGYWRFNSGMQVHPWDWVGVQTSVGLSSLPNATDRTRLEPRASTGVHFQTLYGDGALGRVFIGYAYDEFWEREVFNDPANPAAGTHVEDNVHRYNVDALFMLPFSAYKFHMAARMFADAPIDGEGPSDARFSILFYYDLNGWLEVFQPLGGGPGGLLAGL